MNIEDEDLILIVEDDKKSREMIKSILELNNFKCITTKDGSEALKLINSISPDLIILDLMLPIFDGINVGKEIKSKAKLPYTPIIFLTEIDNYSLLKDVYEAGAVDFITKPFQNLELVARVKAAILASKKHENLEKRAQSLEEKNDEIQKKTKTIEKQNLQLKELEKVKTDYIASVTHDLKTPLTTIRSISEILLTKKSVDENTINRYLNLIINQVDNLTEMIESVLFSVKDMEKSQEVSRENVDIQKLTDKMYENFRVITESKGIDFIYNFESEVKNLNCDKSKIRELLGNILSNAIKFTNEGRVSFTVKHTETHMVFVIEDTGLGMDQKEIKRIFEKYYRAASNKNSVGGSGLGLFICSKIVQSHNGTIDVASKIGVGSEFKVSLPFTF